jgi:signal transduction histidine kinase
MEADAVLPGPDKPAPAEIAHESGRTRITRLVLPRGTVIRKEPLGPDGERRVRHEVAMLERLRGVAGVAQLAGAPRYPGSVVLADAGRASLAGAAKPLAAGELAGLAERLGQAVAGMHRRGVMHRDITPANVVLSGDGRPCLVDFALAASVPEIRPELTHHSEITGTLAYLAPEATGRTGRPADQRADLYALGAVLYELATGEPPFATGDPLRLIHDHLARVPVPTAEANQALPEPLSEIIMHLLEKEPDNRYQTADGLVYDLERVQDAQTRPAAAALRVGEHDVPARLLPPSRLAGRDDEVAALEAAFDGALAGRCRGVLVAGAPGVGKTALIDQLPPVLTGGDGWFVAGMFDPYRRDLVDLVLSEERVDGLLMVGAYREGDMDAAHPLAAPLSRWLDHATMQRLRLVNLAEVIEPYTRGNPYETVELVNALCRDGLLTATVAGWRWDQAAVRAHLGRPDVAGLLAARVAVLPEKSRQVAEAMACLGGRAELSVLQAATGEPAGAIFGDPAGLERNTAAAMPLVPVLPGLYWTAVARLLRALALAEQARSADADQCGGLLSELDEVTQWLADRAVDAPSNFLHLVRLVEAERAWAVGDFRAAALAFDAARREAARRQRPWHRALIAEHAARFYLAHGLEQAGYDLLAQARKEYLAWGATAKVGQLDWAYPALRTPAEAIASDDGQSGDLPPNRAVITTGTIDLLGIVSASQALSSETSIGRLHARVVQVLSAMTGATGVHLLLWDEDRDGWLLPAPNGGGTVPVSATGQDRVAPTSVLRYAQRMREPLVVADAARDDRFARDPYFEGVDCCSLLAVPILSRGAMRAVLLLENRLLGGAFTAARLDAVELVAGQLAVSLDNAQLYAGFREIADEQAALRRVAMLVAQAAAPGSVFSAVAAEAGELLGVDVAVLIRYDPQDAITVVGAWTSTGAAAPTPVGSRLPLGGDNVTTLVFRTGQAARTDYAVVSGVIGDVATRDWGLRSSVGVPIRVEDRLWGAMVVALTREELLPVDAEARLAAFTDLVVTAIANTQARMELQGVAEEQAALRRVATLVARSAPPQEVLTAVTEEAGRLLHAHHAWMSRYDPVRARTVVASWSSTGAAAPVGSRAHHWGQNLSTLVFHTGQPARIDDYADTWSPAADVAQEIGPGAAVGAPISVKGRLWGVMVVASEKEPLPAGTEARLARFTELAATGIANAQAQAEVAASRARIIAAADETRRQIERDLHDGVQQRLVTHALMLSGIRDKVPADVRADLDEARDELAATRQELRDLCQGVHPAILVEVGLGAAIRALARRSPLPVRVQLRADGRLPGSCEVTAYYVAAEAFTNAAKHASASAVDILVEEADGTLTVQVRDDGVGGANAGRGSGLTGLRDRVEAVGGRMTLVSRAGTGTVLTVVLPVTTDDH